MKPESESYGAAAIGLLEAAAQARDDNLIARAKLGLNAEQGVSDFTTDMMIARELQDVTGRMRQLSERRLIGKLMGRFALNPKVHSLSYMPLLQLDNVCPTQPEFIGGSSVVDEFILQAPKSKKSHKDALSIQRRIVDINTDTSEEIGSWGVIVESDADNKVAEVNVVNLENPKARINRFMNACVIFNQYQADYPWLSAFRVDREDSNFAVTIKSDETLGTLQTLVGGDDLERTTVLNEVNAKVSELKKWTYTDEESRYMILGVLLGARKQLRIK